MIAVDECNKAFEYLVDNSWILFEVLHVAHADLHVLQLNGWVWIACETRVDHLIHHLEQSLRSDRRWRTLCIQATILDGQFTEQIHLVHRKIQIPPVRLVCSVNAGESFTYNFAKHVDD